MAEGFRLARLLDLRGRLRSLRQLEAEEVGARCRALLDQTTHLRAERERALDALAAAMAEDDGAPGAMLAARWEEALRARERGTAERLAAERETLDAKRAVLAAERREERKLEHLEQRHRARVAADAVRALERTIDDLAASRHAAERGERDRGD